jgi:hypothetical protein
MRKVEGLWAKRRGVERGIPPPVAPRLLIPESSGGVGFLACVRPYEMLRLGDGGLIESRIEGGFVVF